MKTYVMFDIEANGPIPGDYSMTSLGAVVVGSPNKTFKINIKHLSDKSDPDREKFVDSADAVDAYEAMMLFRDWLKENTLGKRVFVSDNNGFDWMFVCWYFWHYLDENPFGYTSQNLLSIYRGLQRDMGANINALRNRKLLHDALEDAKDNARIFIIIKEHMKDENL